MLRIVAFIAVLAAALAPSALRAQSVGAIGGTVVDAQSGLPVAGASVHILDSTRAAVTDAQGRFTFSHLRPGRYVLRIEHDGFRPAVSDPIAIVGGANASATVAIDRAPAQAAPRIIGGTTARAGQSLQSASVIYRTLQPDALLAAGTVRAADALRRLPGVNNGITGDTGSLGDDVQLSLRGIGQLETTTTLDGHPIGQGLNGNYNFELSPVFALQNINVTYGSGGSDLLGVDAIGGVINLQTLEPTLQPRVTLVQGYGTFDKATTALQATGTSGQIGYALAAGVSSLDGPVHNASVFQPSAAYDQSATDPAVRALGTSKVDSTAVARNLLVKLRWSPSEKTRLTFTSYVSSYWDDKTGNGDTDYLPYDTALASAQNLLANKSTTDTCPGGTFTARNGNGVANGTGPNGQPDGGIRCQTPAQYASFNTGFAGSGPAWQSFGLADHHLRAEHEAGAHAIRLDAYTSRYTNTVDRTYQLPFIAVPGDNARFSNSQIVASGAILSDTIAGRNDDIGFGASYVNSAYLLRAQGVLGPSPVTHEATFFVRNVWHPGSQRFVAYFDANLKHSTVTNTGSFDPRLSLVWRASNNDVIRAAAGGTSTQPYASYLNAPFVPSTLGGAGGGGNINCSNVNSVGTAPSSLLRPERASDEELSIGHRWFGGSQTQLTFYNENVYDKIYRTVVPLGVVGTVFLDPALLAQDIARLGAACGAIDPRNALGVTGNVNVGHVQASGFTLSGRQRLARGLFLDYDWAATSAVLRSAPATLLQRTLTLVPDAQLPHVPLHTLNVALDASTGSGLSARLDWYGVSGNNTKSLPPYSYTNLRIGVPAGPGALTFAVDNLFNQYADVRGLLGEGVPLALNAYAKASDYALLVGAGATERFGLPPRSAFLSYTWRLR